MRATDERERGDIVMRFAYADPPYFGQGKKRYGEHHPDASVWDSQESHTDLLKRITAEFPDGWVYATNPAHLVWQLAVCPEDARVGAWCKTWHQIRPTTTQFAWEAVIWRTTKKLPKRTMVRDWITGPATRGKGLCGAKPDYYNRWVLDLLGYEDGDEIVDLFPGTGGLSVVLAQGRLLT